MDVDRYKNLAKATKELSSQSAESILKSAKYLRSRYLKRNCEKEAVDIFCKLNGAKTLASLLNSAHKDELYDTILSILANCCVVSDKARKQVIDSDGVKQIGRILNQLAKQSIQDRACRLLGNITKDPISHDCIRNNKNVVAYVLEYLKSSINDNNKDAVKIAIRTLRFLVKVPDFPLEVTDLELFPKIVEQIKSAGYELYEPILQLLSDFAEMPQEEPLYQQIISCGLLPIMVKFTSSKSCRLQHLALSFLVSLSANIGGHIGNAGTIPVFINALDDSTWHSIKEKDLIEALCHMLYTPNNRHRMNRYNGYKYLADALESEDEQLKCLHDFIIESFLQCLYDDTSMSALQHLHIIPCLLQHLNRFIEKHSTDHSISQNESESRNKIDLSVFDVCAEDIRNLFHRSTNNAEISTQQFFDPDVETQDKACEKEEYSVNSPSYQRILVNQAEINEPKETAAQTCSEFNLSFSASASSPALSTSASGYSPLGCIVPASPSSSLSFVSDTVMDDYQKLIYSDEEEINYDFATTSACASPKYVKRRRTSDFKNWGKQRRKSGSETKASFPAVDVKMKKDRPSHAPTDDQKFMDSIFTILAKYTWRVDEKPIAASVVDHIPAYFETFMTFISKVPMAFTMVKYGHSVLPFYSACKTLCRIASDFECFAKMITSSIPKMILNIYESLEHDDNLCEQCFVIRRLCRKILKRDLKSVAESRLGQAKLQELMSESVENKIKVAQFLPCLITSQKLVQKFYLHLDLISHLLNSLEEEPEEEIFIDSARSIIALSKVLGITHSFHSLDEDKLPVKCLYNINDALSDVWFILGDGDKIGARKAALLNADFFRAMFCGNFSETDQTSITVEDASLEAFSLIMHYLHCSSIPCDRSIDLMSDCRIMLELLQLADKYLLKDLQFSLHDQIINCINEDNVTSIYCSASLIQDEHLVKSTLCFVLVGNIDVHAKVRCIQNLMRSEFKSLALHHITKLLRNEMNP